MKHIILFLFTINKINDIIELKRKDKKMIEKIIEKIIENIELLFVLWFLTVISILGGVGYVAAHFISKIW